ncbi:hypothetical protein R84981_002777 [Carnimonas sp. R-84981]|uniref:phage portal protein n=1 Tax=Carnimonas bestiolae TaxID=3402172 RepID=UPI003EDC6892
MPTYNQDGYRSAVLGERRDNRFIYNHSAVYARGGIAARIIDKPADDAMGRGIILDGDEDNAVSNELERLKFCSRVADALRWSRLDGGSALLVLTDTGQLSEEMPENIGEITELKVIERYQLSVAPGGYYSDPNQGNFGQPETYQITLSGTGTGIRPSFYVHESRLLPVYGLPLPGAQRSTLNTPWMGRSAANDAFRTVEQYERSLMLSLETLKRKQQAVHKMAGLAQLIESGQEAAVRQRVDLVDEVRSLMNGVAIDAEDDYNVYDLNVSGLKDVIGEFQVAVSAATGIPVTVLFGRSVAGLNSTGQHDLESYYDLCEGLQRNSVQPALERLINIIGRQRSVNLPDKLEIKWPSLWTPTDDEKAATELKEQQANQAEATAINTLIDTGALSERQAQDYLVSQGKYGLTNEQMATSTSD